MPIAPIMSLVAATVPEVLNLFGRANQAQIVERIGAIAKSVSGKEAPEAASAILADPALALDFKKALLASHGELARLAFEEQKLYVEDVRDARRYRDDKVFWLGVVILLSFVLCIALVMWGGYHIMSSRVEVEARMFAAITGFLGTLIGYVAASAQSVVSYYFGSSRGSTQKTDAIEDAVKTFEARK